METEEIQKNSEQEQEVEETSNVDLLQAQYFDDYDSNENVDEESQDEDDDVFDFDKYYEENIKPKVEEKSKESKNKGTNTNTNSSIDADTEQEIVSLMKKRFLDKAGIVEDVEVNSLEELVEIVDKYIDDNITAEFASKEVENLNEFIKNGGTFQEFIQKYSELKLPDLNSVDLEKEEDQRKVLAKFLEEKGMAEKQIRKYINALDEEELEDEAKEAYDYLKEKERLLNESLAKVKKEEQAKKQEEARKHYESIVNTIRNSESFHGFTLSKKDKEDLIEFITKPDKTGKTQYQKLMEDPANAYALAIVAKKQLFKYDNIVKLGKSVSVEDVRKKLNSNKKEFKSSTENPLEAFFNSLSR